MADSNKPVDKNKLVGQNYSTPEIRAKVTGRSRYAEDFKAQGMLHCRLLLSPYSHARVLTIDASAALAMPGVKAILTADEVPGPKDQVNDAGQTMEEIVASVTKVTELISEITAASKEQAQGIEQVSETMTQLEKVTQQNAAMVEQASAASGSLEEQSRALSSAVSAFRLHAEVEARKPVEVKMPVEVKQSVKANKPVKTKKPEPHVAVAAKKGNGHLQEGWQEF